MCNATVRNGPTVKLRCRLKTESINKIMRIGRLQSWNHKKQEEKDNIAKEVVKVIMGKKSLVMRTVNKKTCVIIFDLNEKVQLLRFVREKKKAARHHKGYSIGRAKSWRRN